MVLVFSSGGFQQHQWLGPGLVLTLFALVAALFGAYPRRPRQLSMGVLALFALYALWVTLSARWAPSLNSVWDEAGRTFVYLLALTLALIYFTDAGARRAGRYLILIAAIVLIEVVVSRLQASGGVAPGAAGGIEMLFNSKRFVYPLSYPNNAAALYLILFWPLLWMAADSQEWVPIRGLSLAGCWGLLALFILTQSRGGLWALAITLVFLFALSPARLRTLVYLAVPATLTVWGFPRLNSYWDLGPEKVGPGPVVRTVLLGMAIAAAVGIALALLERWVQVSRRVRLSFGTGILVVLLGLSVYGYVLLDQHVGDPGRWFRESWSAFTAEKQLNLAATGSGGGESEAASRFAIVSASGRWDIWRVAWEDFRSSPWKGVGAGNFVYTYDKLRHSETAKPRQPHSQELQVLGETGIVGGILFYGAFFLGLGGLLWPRFSAGWHSVRRPRGPPGPDAAGEAAATPAADDAMPAASRAEGEGGAGHADGTAPPAPAAGTARRPPRWGDDPRLYAWETMLAVAVIYWHVHGSAEWLWHMPGVTLPVVLLFALGVASVDARAGVLWPRLAAFLPHLRQIGPFLTPPMLLMMRRRRAAARAEAARRAHAATDDAGPTPALVDGAGAAADDRPLTTFRRADRHLDRNRRRDRAAARRRRRDEALVPPGAISLWFRRVLTVTAVVVLVGLALPYLSLRLQSTALSNVGRDDQAALRSARLAARLEPADPRPVLVEADIYRYAAVGAGREAALDDLALSLDAHVRALRRNPADWAVHQRAGQAVLRLLEQSLGIPQGSLTGQDGEAAGTVLDAKSVSLVTPSTKAKAELMRSFTPEELRLLARSYFLAAQARNPLNPQIRTGLTAADEAATLTKAGSMGG